MDPGNGELKEVSGELQTVKRALQDGAIYLGMKGDTLTSYFLELQKKENLVRQESLLASKQYHQHMPVQHQHMSVGGGNVGLAAGPPTNGSSGLAERAPAAAQEPARPPPPGPAKVINKDSQEEVLEHMIAYEAVPAEAVKALRAVSSLAYSNAAKVGADDRLIAQLLRLAELHSPAVEDSDLHWQVQVAAMRALCNTAYDQDVALKKLTDRHVLSALIGAVAAEKLLPADSKDKKPSEAAAKAGEALARIVAAEVNPDGNGLPAKPVVDELHGSMVSVFLAAALGTAADQQAVPRLLAQLVSNEVCDVKAIARRFATAAKAAETDTHTGIGWMELAKILAVTEDVVPMLPWALVEEGAIKAAATLMTSSSEASLQLAGTEAMSALVGNRWGGLQSFAASGGMSRIQAAMQGNPSATLLQTKGIRALASGIQWPEDIQAQAGFDVRTSVVLTKTALATHGDSVDLLQAGLEALSKYLDKTKCRDLVQEEEGEQLVKGIMTQHKNVTPVFNAGRVVLDHLGVDRAWEPGPA